MTEPRQHTARDLAVWIIAKLRDAGHTAYLAGGCVRDRLLGLEPKDHDVATDARPEQVLERFRGSRAVGEAFGVVLVRRWRQEVEVATFRAEWGYEDGRRPSHVEFTDAEHDARRRDFTINGLFEDPLAEDPDAMVIDHVGGMADLEQGIVRAIGDADERFGEDHLRMLRAVRFASRLDFRIEAGTLEAIRRQARWLGQISRERIGQEVRLMLTGPHPAAAARMVQQLGLDGPTLNQDHADPPLPALETLAPPLDAALAVAAWMLDRHLADYADVLLDAASLAAPIDQLLGRGRHGPIARWRDALCLTNDERDRVLAILSQVRRALDWPELPVAQRKRLLAEPPWPLAEQLLQAMTGRPGVRPIVAAIESDAPELHRQGVAPPPFVSGDDLVDLGIRPGPDLGRLLEQVYDRQLEGRLRDREQALSWVRDQLA